ncbi:MAG: hypothetical protein QXL88_01005 [Candidatus Pacearchaeota archaeon]
MKINRKAIHHVEYVVAVSIFLVAVFFLLYFYTFSVAREKLPIEQLEKIFRESTEANVTIVVLKLQTQSQQGCYNVTLNSNLPNKVEKIFIKSNEEVPFNITNGRLLISGSSDNFTLYSLASDSENFNSRRISGASCSEVSHSYSIAYAEKLIFEEKLKKMDYGEIKEKLGRDFFIKVAKQDEIVFNTTRLPPFNALVESKELKLKMINATADIVEVMVNLQVW